MRTKLKLLLKDYSMEEILEVCDVDPIEALELLVTYGALNLENIVEGSDHES